MKRVLTEGMGGAVTVLVGGRHQNVVFALPGNPVSVKCTVDCVRVHKEVVAIITLDIKLDRGHP